MAPRGENRAKLIDAMRTLSLTKGFPATTVDEVCTEAQVSKGSFYHHFATKDDLGQAALDGFFDELVLALTTGPFAADEDPVERLRRFVTHAGVVCSGPLLTHGCMLGSFTLDLAESHPDMRDKLSQQFSTLASYVADLIRNAGDDAGVALPAEELAQQFLAVIEGSIVLAKAHADPNIVNSGLALFANHLDLLLHAAAG